MTAVLRLQNLSLHRDGPILRNISWEVRPGEHWAVLGPNGCGKTTLLNALAGYATPVDGTMELFGEAYGATDWRELRGRVGLVSTSLLPRVDDGERAWEIVVSGRHNQLNFWGRSAPDDRSRAERLLKQVGIAALSESPWRQLSAGERQRTLIARALNGNPALLLLDEPCAHLDPAAREKFLRFLDGFAARRKEIPFVYVTHHLEEITPAFSHALLLKRGRALASGPAAKILNEGNLQRLFGAHVRLKKAGFRRRLEFF